MKWDIIISGYHMPKFSALTAYNLLQISGSDIPFLLAFGTLGPELAAAAMRAGINEYNSKAELETKLIPAIEHALSEAEYRRRLIKKV